MDDDTTNTQSPQDSQDSEASHETEIKDPIYDIMSDKEAQEAFDRLMELADATDDSEPEKS